MNTIIQKEYQNELIEELEDNHEFIHDEDDMRTFIDQWIETKTTYIRESKEIVEAFDYDVFQMDPNFDEYPRSWEQAAQFALYEMWFTMTYTWKQLENYKLDTEVV